MSCDVLSPPNPTRWLHMEIWFLFRQTHFGSNKHKCLFNSHVFVWLHHRFLPIGHVKILNSFDWTISIRSKFVFIRFCRMLLTTHGKLNSFNQTIFTPNNPLYDHKWVITFATVLKLHIWPQFENLFPARTQRSLATLGEHIFKLKRYFPHPLPQRKTHHFLLYLTLFWL
jgi:hypothetical protein